MCGARARYIHIEPKSRIDKVPIQRNDLLFSYMVIQVGVVCGGMYALIPPGNLYRIAFQEIDHVLGHTQCC